MLQPAGVFENLKVLLVELKHTSRILGFNLIQAEDFRRIESSKIPGFPISAGSTLEKKKTFL